jgi:phage terminase large subunit-like protein
MPKKKPTRSTNSSEPKKPKATSASQARPDAVPGYVYDQAKADRVARFIETLCVMSKGEWAGRPMELLPWQKRDILDPLFGWLDDQGRRRFRTAAIYTPKKQGKSTLLSALALYFLVGDAEPGAEVISAASDRQQAGIIAREAASMVRASPSLSRVLEVIDSRNTILHRASNSRYTVISADSFRAEGLNASAVLLDETHSQRDTKLYDALRYAGAARRSPMVISISTAGYDRRPTALWWQLWQYAEKVAANPAHDPTFFGKIYRASEDPAKWFDEAEWFKANPSLGVTVSLESFRADAVQARKNPAALNQWARYRINVPTETDRRWFTPEVWAGNGGELQELGGRACFAGLDLASNRDITAAVFVYRGPEGTYDVDPIFWVPEDTVAERENKDRIPYSQWIREGYVRTTPGARLDHDTVAAEIVSYAQAHNVQKIGADPWNLGNIATKLQSEGLEVVGIQQNTGSLSAPSKLLESLLYDKRLRHGNNPVLSWMAGNVALYTDSNGNIKPDKARSTEKIDGIVALIMGLALASVASDDGPSDWSIQVI